MPIKTNCAKCGKEFKYRPYRPAKYCSRKCYLEARFYVGGKCIVCGKKARILYCSEVCRKKYWNKHGYAKHKKKYYWDKKISIIKTLGNKCSECGNNDIRVLDINHIDRLQKKRPSHGTYTWSWRLKEWKGNMKNLELLCANCHRIHTWK